MKYRIQFEIAIIVLSIVIVSIIVDYASITESFYIGRIIDKRLVGYVFDNRTEHEYFARIEFGFGNELIKISQQHFDELKIGDYITVEKLKSPFGFFNKILIELKR